MRISTVPDGEFLSMYSKLGPNETARRLGISQRRVYYRRSRLERQGFEIKAPGSQHNPNCNLYRIKSYPWRIPLEVKNGTVIVASDAHYWPGPPSLMHQALLRFLKDCKPKAIILNGDVIDAPSISRFNPIGWESRPDLVDEIEAAQDRCHEIEKASGRIPKIWTLGNHDARFESRLAHVAPEFAKIKGVHLKDHFPIWEPAWAVWINKDTVIKHRFKGGIHAPRNNTIHAGKSIITGHLHSAQVVPFTDYNDTRYGVDGGCVAETDHKAFIDYTEDNPKNWCSAFCVLTFKEGRLMQPELVLKWDEKRIQFRGWVGVP